MREQSLAGAMDGFDQAVPTRDQVDHRITHQRRGDFAVLMATHAIGHQKQPE